MSYETVEILLHSAIVAGGVWVDVTDASQLPSEIDREKESKVMQFRNHKMRLDGDAVYFVFCVTGGKQVVESVHLWGAEKGGGKGRGGKGDATL